MQTLAIFGSTQRKAWWRGKERLKTSPVLAESNIERLEIGMTNLARRTFPTEGTVENASAHSPCVGTEGILGAVGQSMRRAKHFLGLFRGMLQRR